MEHIVGAGDSVGAGARAGGVSDASIAMSSVYRFEARDPQGNLKWVEEVKNLVTNQGLNNLLDTYLKGSGYTAAFYVGLTDGTPTVAAGDTVASAAGWAEVTAYDETDRQALTLGTVASQSVDNSASRAVFTISTNGTTIGGGFITTDDTKGGTAGVMYSVAEFAAGDKLLDDGDTLSVTVTLTAASA